MAASVQMQQQEHPIRPKIRADLFLSTVSHSGRGDTIGGSVGADCASERANVVPLR